MRHPDLVLDAQGVAPRGPGCLPALQSPGLVTRGGGGMVATDRVNFLFADPRSLYDDALEMFDQGKIRNAAEKAWGTTKRATDLPSCLTSSQMLISPWYQFRRDHPCPSA